MLALLIAACATSVMTGCDDDDELIEDSSLLVINESDFVITDVYLTEVDNPDFGPNLLFGDVLLPGEDLLLGVDCGFFDALVIDEDGVECRLFDLDLCLNDATWVIRNNTCAVFGAAN
ncbi:MAG: hypothetical protein SFX73_08965 [Kofleriaceae bacterium]|nr:hypothetical protein [Kofleriaceae bacterium]